MGVRDPAQPLLMPDGGCEGHAVLIGITEGDTAPSERVRDSSLVTW